MFKSPKTSKSLRYSLLTALVLLCVVLLFPTLFTTVQASTTSSSSSGNVIFILDASGSMRGQVGGRAKIDIARKVLKELVQNLPNGLNVGLVAYGHRRKGDCSDVEELVPLSPLDKKSLINKINGLYPKGKTPISFSVKLTAEKLRNLEEETTIVLVSDGKETCGGDPCELVRKLKESGIKFVMHVVGFDVTREEKKQLECIAKAGGGTYYTARNANEFHLALRKVVSKPEFKGSLLKVTAVKNGKRFPALVAVFKHGTDQKVAEGFSEPPRPYSIKLLPGTYDIRVQDKSVPGEPVVNIKGVLVESGKTTEKLAEFRKEGIVNVTGMKSGKPFPVLVAIFKHGTDQKVAEGFSEPPRPYSIKLLPGTYDIRVQDKSVPGEPVVSIKGVLVESGKTTEKLAEFQ